uniref:Uncharacterized protein n=1 Tax=Davidia involucrata TaxID=16924 RepID=A0A5B7AA65_DAVIN
MWQNPIESSLRDRSSQTFRKSLLVHTMAGDGERASFPMPPPTTSSLGFSAQRCIRAISPTPSIPRWHSREQDSETDLLPKLLSGALKARKNVINVKVKPNQQNAPAKHGFEGCQSTSRLQA